MKVGKHYANIDAVLSKTFTSQPTWTETTSKQELPDARLHQLISFIKSGIRIVGYIFIPFNLIIATGLLVLSEVVGIVEELV